VATYVPVTDLADIYDKHPVTSGTLSQLKDNILALYQNTHAYARTTGDVTINNDDTLTNDAELMFTAAVGGKWCVTLVLGITTTVNADFKFDIVTPDAAPGGRIWTCRTSEAYAGQSDTSLTVTYGAVATAEPLVIRSVLDLTATGDVHFQWAQGTAHADSTTVHEGSFLMAYRTSKL
jgi:hypothetical protein